jgi:Tfp pilus assembly protein PilV
MLSKFRRFLIQDEGLSLLEVLVAVVILGIVGVTLLNGISSSNNQASKATKSQISFSYLTSAAENLVATPFVTCNSKTNIPAEYSSALTSSPGTFPIQVARVEALYQSPSSTNLAGVWYDCSNWPADEKGSYLQRITLINTDGTAKGICNQTGIITSSSATTTITGLTSTAGFTPGMNIFKIVGSTGTGNFNGTARIISVDSPTQLTITTSSTIDSSVQNLNSPGQLSLSACSRTVFKNLVGVSSSFAVTPLSPRTLFYGKSKSVSLSTVNAPSNSRVIFFILPGSNLPTTCSSTALAVSLSGSTLYLCVGSNYSGTTRLSVDIGAFDLNNSKYATPASLLIDVYPPLDLDTVGPLSTVSGSQKILDARARTGVITAATTPTTITGLNSTAGLLVGATLIKNSGSGAFGGTTTITSIDSPTQITISSASANTAGPINFFSTSSQYQLVAVGGNGLNISFASNSSSRWPGINLTNTGTGIVTLGVTSTTSNTITSGSKTFSVSDSSLFSVNQNVRASYVSTSSPPQVSFLEGLVTSVNLAANQVTINATSVGGPTGTFTSWRLVTAPSSSNRSTEVLIKGGGQDIGPPEETTSKTFDLAVRNNVTVNSSDICLSSSTATCTTSLSACPSTSGAGTCYVTLKTASNSGVGLGFPPNFVSIAESTSSPAIAVFSASTWDAASARWSIVLKADYTAANGRFCRGVTGGTQKTANVTNFFDTFTTWSIPFDLKVKC